MKIRRVSFFFSILISISSFGFSQGLSGVVKNGNNELLDGAHVTIVETGKSFTSDKKGNFNIGGVSSDKITLLVSFVGYKSSTNIVDLSSSNQVEIILQPDLLSLEGMIVTGTHIPTTNKELSVAISSITKQEISVFGTNGTASLVQRVPGIYADASAGEVFTRVYSRGVSISAEDDLGWYYMGLQEDGLPITAIQFASFAPDLFHRIDGTLDHVEVVRGGSASVSGVGTPGGVFNFISKPIGDSFNGRVALQTGLLNNGNIYNKTDLLLDGPLGEKFGYQIGLSHRYDQGERNIDYDLSKGGHIKYKLNYKLGRGSLQLYGKHLNDHVNRWTGVTASNWKSPAAANNQDFSTTSQLMPAKKGTIPDGTGGYYDFDPSNGIHTQENTIGLLFETKLGDKWHLENNFKMSSKSANWQTSLSNAILPLDGFLPYFISGADFPIGQVIFRNPNTTQEVARVDNSGILGDPPSFSYLTEGRLAFDAILGVAAWYKEDESDEYMNQLSVQGRLGRHNILGGVFASLSSVNSLTRASFAYASYDPKPISLNATLENPGQEILYLSDQQGFSNYGGLFYGRGNADVKQVHLFIQDQFEIAENLQLDIGIRLEQINHKGQKDRAAPLDKDGGWDGDEQTAYDNSILVPTGEVDQFDYDYTNFAYSFGLNYEISSLTNAFGRFSKGGKAPELDYYFDNFSNVPIDRAGPIQDIYQAEGGLKFSGKSLTVVPVLFWSELRNVGTSNFVFDQESGSIFYTPMQFNSTQTWGLELESIYHPTNNFLLSVNATIQKHKALDYKVYDANGTIDEADDEIRSYDGNRLPFNPNLMLNVTPEYHMNRMNFYFNWRFMGEREGNIANAFQLPAYSIFNIGATMEVLSGLVVGLHVKNIFSSEGLMNFYGPNFFGASKDDATQEYIDGNPNGQFVVTPVQPRVLQLNLSYSF